MPAVAWPAAAATAVAAVGSGATAVGGTAANTADTADAMGAVGAVDGVDAVDAVDAAGPFTEAPRAGAPPATVVPAPPAGEGEDSGDGDALADGDGGGGEDAAGLLGAWGDGSRLGAGLGRTEEAPLGEGRADADALGGTALLRALGDALAPGDTRAGPEAVAPGRPGAAYPGALWLADAVGTGLVSTWRAGSSSFWPGTGSQGALELPDRSVATMTTAYAAQAIPTRMPIRRNVRLRRPDSSTNTGTSEAS
ncbi:hypothetical protein [Streptomyces sp. NPDC002328]|uniref:hypothetical protein n=1 Tax=Streptomyces sp. NPDC002328 TaxID=3364642 RepID=UPI0036C1241E